MAISESSKEFLNQIGGIQGDGAADTLAEFSEAELQAVSEQLKAFNESYGFCSRNQMAHAWYLNNRAVDPADEAAREKIDAFFKDTNFSRDQRIENAYEYMKEKHGESSEKWKNIEQDKAQIDADDENKSEESDKSEKSDNLKKSKKFGLKSRTPDNIVLECKLPGNYSNCVPAKEKSERKYKFSKEASATLNKKLGTNIDFPFVARLEESSEFGYVPWGKGAPKGNHSGVTVATGFDLGGRKETELRNLKVSEPLIEKLKPYLGKQKQDACNALAKKPLALTGEEAAELDAIEFESKAKEIIKRWNALAEKKGATRFEDLTQGQQTVLFSRTYQHGPGWVRFKTYADFLEQALSGNWGNGEAQCACVKNYKKGHTKFCTENACCTYFDIATKSDYKKRMLLEASEKLKE